MNNRLKHGPKDKFAARATNSSVRQSLRKVIQELVKNLPRIAKTSRGPEIRPRWKLTPKFENLELRMLLTGVPPVSVYESEVHSPNIQQEAADGWRSIDSLVSIFTLDQSSRVKVNGIANVRDLDGQELLELRLLVNNEPGPVIQAGRTSYGQAQQYPGIMDGTVEPIGIVSAGYGDGWNLLPEILESRAALFSGGRISVPDQTAFSINPGGAFTIEAWINPTGFQSGAPATIVNKFNHQTGEAEYVFELLPNGALRFANRSGGLVDSAPSAVPLNNWSHVAVTISNGTIHFYVNGQLTGSGAVNPSFNNTREPLQIGGSQNTPLSFLGRMDEVAIYPRALSQGELNSRLSSLGTRDYRQLVEQSGPISYWRLDEFAGASTVADSASGFTGRAIAP